VKEAQQTVYNALDRLEWPGGFYRRDIAYRAVAYEENK